MAILKEGGASFTPCPRGTHIARCVQFIDLGTQYSAYYDKWSHKGLIGWEIPGETRETEEGEEPFLVWHRYTLSLHQNSALRAHLESWRGRAFTKEELQGFDTKNILDKPCMLSIVHTEDGGNTYANVSAVMAIPKGTEVPDRFHEIRSYDIEDGENDVFDTFSDRLKETIRGSKEFKNVAEGDHALDQQREEHPIDDDDDIPF